MARPRLFDLDQAVEIATRLFCARGYHSTSIGDLTEAIGILRGSLYQAFPDKHSLLLAALDRYRSRQIDTIRGALFYPGRSAAESLRETLVKSALETAQNGCLMAGLTQELLPVDPVVTARIAHHYQQVSELFEESLWKIRDAGQLRESTDIPATALMLVVMLQGLRTLGRTAPSPQQLYGCVDALLTPIVTHESKTLAAIA